MDRTYIWTNIPNKDHLIKLINIIILRGEDGVFQKELVWHIALIYAWIYCIDQTFNVVLRKVHVGRKEYGLIRREVWTCTNLQEPLSKCVTLWELSKCMFCVRCKTSTCLYILDLHRDALTIWALEPLGTTGKVCWYVWSHQQTWR